MCDRFHGPAVRQDRSGGECSQRAHSSFHVLPRLRQHDPRPLDAVQHPAHGGEIRFPLHVKHRIVGFRHDADFSC
jgi:hypothetical protein